MHLLGHVSSFVTPQLSIKRLYWWSGAAPTVYWDANHEKPSSSAESLWGHLKNCKAAPGALAGPPLMFAVKPGSHKICFTAGSEVTFQQNRSLSSETR